MTMTHIDHLIIAVSDLDAASETYVKLLGRQPSWRGKHPSYGSANTLFRLDNLYIELLAADGSGVGADLVRTALGDRDNAMAGLVFGTDDLAAFIRRAQAQGLGVSAPTEGEGVDERSGLARRWRNVFWPVEAARGLTTFCICHESGSELPLAPAQTNAAIAGVDHVVVSTQSADAAKHFYGEQIGLRLALEQHVPEWGGTQLFFRSNGMSIEVIATEKAKPVDRFWGIAYTVDDIEAVHRRLTSAGVVVSEVRAGRKTGTRVMTVKSHTLDVPTLLIQHL